MPIGECYRKSGGVWGYVLTWQSENKVASNAVVMHHLSFFQSESTRFLVDSLPLLHGTINSQGAKVVLNTFSCVLDGHYWLLAGALNSFPRGLSASLTELPTKMVALQVWVGLLQYLSCFLFWPSLRSHTASYLTIRTATWLLPSFRWGNTSHLLLKWHQ